MWNHINWNNFREIIRIRRRFNHFSIGNVDFISIPSSICSRTVSRTFCSISHEFRWNFRIVNLELDFKQNREHVRNSKKDFSFSKKGKSSRRPLNMVDWFGKTHAPTPRNTINICPILFHPFTVPIGNSADQLRSLYPLTSIKVHLFVISRCLHIDFEQTAESEQISHSFCFPAFTTTPFSPETEKYVLSMKDFPVNLPQPNRWMFERSHSVCVKIDRPCHSRLSRPSRDHNWGKLQKKNIQP